MSDETYRQAGAEFEDIPPFDSAELDDQDDDEELDAAEEDDDEGVD